jgi:hypothetical protein
VDDLKKRRILHKTKSPKPGTFARGAGGHSNGKISQIRESGPAESEQDMLTEILRERAHQLQAEVLEVEIQEFIGQYRDLRDERGRPRVVRNGHHRVREVQTGDRRGGGRGPPDTVT